MVRKQVLTVAGWLQVVPVIAAEQFTNGPTARTLAQAAAEWGRWTALKASIRPLAKTQRRAPLIRGSGRFSLSRS